MRIRRTALTLILAIVMAMVASPALAGRNHARSVRFATFNASLNRAAEGELVADLSTQDDPQARVIAETIQRVRPDVLLVNEFDYVPAGVAVNLFHDNYLQVGQNGAAPITYPYRLAFPSNTGIASGFDLNNDGQVVTTPGAPGYGDDALGFGAFPGQFAFAVYSRYPIQAKGVRTFQTFLWQDMPGALLPPGFYSPEELEVLRLSSKNHVDLPIKIGRRTVHLLASHPTPPTFDGPEDRNGRRNHDEIRFWADYISPGRRSAYIYDDQGRYGGLRPGARFVIAGDQNADPVDGDSVDGAIQQLLSHPLVRDPRPASDGAVEAAAVQGGANAVHQGPPQLDTADFNDNPAPGNLRVDYVLPRKGLRVTDAAVFWPVSTDPLFRLVGTFPFPGSDHRLVHVDLRIRGR